MLNILVHNLQIHKGSQSVLFVRTLEGTRRHKGGPCIRVITVVIVKQPKSVSSGQFEFSSEIYSITN
jgi:hypothetical protein